MLSLIVDWPCPQRPNIEPIPIMPQLVVWSISGKAIKDFQDKVLISSLTLGDKKLVNHMTHYLANGIAGVLDRFRYLFKTCEHGSFLYTKRDFSITQSMLTGQPYHWYMTK